MFAWTLLNVPCLNFGHPSISRMKFLNKIVHGIIEPIASCNVSPLAKQKKLLVPHNPYLSKFAFDLIHWCLGSFFHTHYWWTKILLDFCSWLHNSTLKLNKFVLTMVMNSHFSNFLHLKVYYIIVIVLKLDNKILLWNVNTNTSSILFVPLCFNHICLFFWGWCYFNCHTHHQSATHPSFRQLVTSWITIQSSSIIWSP